MSDTLELSDIEKELEEAEALEMGEEPELEEEQEQPEIEEQPHAEEVEAEEEEQEEAEDPDAEQAEEEQQQFEYNDQVPIAKFTQEKRTRRKLERVKDGLEKTLGEKDAAYAELQKELAEARQQVAFAKSHGSPDMPTEVDHEAIRAGDPDAIANALLLIQNQQQAAPATAPEVAEAPEVTPEQQQANAFEQMLDEAPKDSPLHELGEWYDSSGDNFAQYDAVRQIAAAEEAKILETPEFKFASMPVVLTEVARRVKEQVTAKADAAISQSRANARTLTNTSGTSAEPSKTLLDRYMTATDENEFIMKLTPAQMTELQSQLSQLG